MEVECIHLPAPIWNSCVRSSDCKTSTPKHSPAQGLGQGCRTYGTRQSLLGQCIFLHDQRPCIVKNVCVYTHTHLTTYRLCIAVATKQYWEWNIFTLIRNGAKCVDWIFVTAVPAWQWLDEYMTFHKTFCSLHFKEEVAAAPVTSKFSSLSRAKRRHVVEI